jgi:ribosome maturation factor RimP
MLASHLSRSLVLAGRPRLFRGSRGVGSLCGTTANRRARHASPAVSAFAVAPRERQARVWSTSTSFGAGVFRHATLSIQTRDVTTYAKKKSKNPTDDGEESADVSSDDDGDDEGFDSDFDSFVDDELMMTDENGAPIADGEGDIGVDDDIYTAGTDWGETALASLALVLKDDEFDGGLAIFSFKVSEERRRIYISIDAVRDKFGSPTLDMLSSVSRKFNAELEEKGFPDDVALEVASPGAERHLRLPNDIPRFAELTMKVTYVDPADETSEPQTRVLQITEIDETQESATWKLADVEENRPQAKKGQGMNKKQREWRLTAPFSAVKTANLFVGF